MKILHITRPTPLAGLDDIPVPSEDAPLAQALLVRCPVAAQTAEENGWEFLSEGFSHGYAERLRRLMEGYTVLMAEAILQLPDAPTNIFLQAGVGGWRVPVLRWRGRHGATGRVSLWWSRRPHRRCTGPFQRLRR